MTVLAALSGFFLYLSLLSVRPSLSRIKIARWARLVLDLFLCLTLLASGVFIIFCSAIFHIGQSGGDLKLFYDIGRALSSPWVNVSIVFFVIGGWVAAYRQEILKFFIKKL